MLGGGGTISKSDMAWLGYFRWSSRREQLVVGDILAITERGVPYFPMSGSITNEGVALDEGSVIIREHNRCCCVSP